MKLPSFILLLTISSASLLAFIHCYDDDAMKKLEDKIVSLPGEPDRGGIEFDQYSGFVTVDPDAGRALFYYFVESPHSSKPLLLWLNGGPACSSLGGGAMAELGPFRVNKDGATLSYNKYAWNNVANILFLESPAGDGFSYSNKTSDYDKNGDKRTAEDSYTFLVKWIERFPEYKTRDFFIAGESYAGHYVPQLAQLILKNNKISNQTFINLKGIAMGNAYIDYESEFTGFYEHLWLPALLSDEIYQVIVSNCNFSSLETVSEACKDYTDQAGIARGKILLYDIYSPLCNSLFSKNYPAPTEFDPCTDDYIYFVVLK